jgi:glycosyltransferase involved in cell wall biosynthesis/O-antigen/teichoic acid export membrane protein
VRSLSVQVRRKLDAPSSKGVLDFSRATSLLLLAIGLLNGSNYLFHVGVSRLMGPSDYGALAALLAVLMILSVPFGVLQTVVAQRTAALGAKGRSDEIPAFVRATAGGVFPVALAAGAAVLVLAAPAITIFLDVSFASASLLAPFVLLATLLAIPLGVLQGTMRFGAFAVLVLSGVVIRLGSGIGLVELGFGVPGAMLASSLATATSLVVGLWLIGLSGGWLARTRRSLEPIRGEFGVALMGMISFWLLAQADIGLARHYLEPEQAGFYSSAGLLARTLLFMPAAVALVAFPRFVEARERKEDAFYWLRTSLLFGGVLVVVAFPVLVVLRRPVVELTFGASFRPAADLMPLLCSAMAVLALVGVLTYFHIAMGSRAYVISIIGLALEVVLIALFHESPQQIAAIVTCVAVGVALTQFAAARSLCRWRPPLERLAPPTGPQGLLTSEPTVELSVVLPCHNAGGALGRMLEDLIHQLDFGDSYELIVVSDGSTDESVDIAEGFTCDHLRVFHYAQRGGKGHALQLGLTEARGRYVAFVDSDGDIGPEAIRPFLTIMKLYEPDLVLGSKRHPLSEVCYPPLRRVMSWTYHKLVRLLFRVNVRDTQTGLKLIRRDVLAAVLPRLLEKRYAFDLELLVAARSLGYKRVFEAPVRIEYKFGSQVGVRSVARIILDTAAIFYRHNILGSYRAERPPVPEASALVSTAALGNGNPVAAPSVSGAARNERRLRMIFLNWRDLANPEAGGAEVFTHEVAKRWVAQGHHVTLLTSGFAGCAPTENRDGIRIRRLGRLRSGSFHVALQRELARVRGFDVVIDGINTIPSLAAVWRGRLPFTLAVVYQLGREVWACELPRPVAAIGRWLEPRLLRPYRDVPTVAISNSTSEDLIELGFRQVVVVPPGRDEPPSLGIVRREPQPTFLFVGRLSANKRPDHAIDAFNHIRDVLPDARLWIAGRGPLERDLQFNLPAGAELLGFVSRDELYARMARAHCLLVPSVREGWGLVVVEANSVGTPAVAYNVPGLRDSVQDGITGLLAEDGDPRDLARCAIDIVGNPALHQAMSRKATAWAEKFSWDETANCLLTLIHEWREPKLPREAHLVKTNSRNETA